jgi:hypothetical protein
MALLKKEYSFSNKRQIWRLIPTDTDKIIIEERDQNNKEVFFNCLKINNGKVLIKDLQLQDKFWIGIETVYKDIIYFHKFLTPEMPVHNGIIAFDIISQKVIWKKEEFNFLFIKDDKIYVYISKFEDKDFFTLDFKTGDQIEELGNDSKKINEIREEELKKNMFEDYRFPQPVNFSSSDTVKNIVAELKEERAISGEVSYVRLDHLLLFSFHETISNGNLRNIFNAVEISSKKVILEEILDRETKLFIPESFFVKNNLVFILKEKVKLIVYSF